MTKPQNVNACAAPGIDHFSSLRCPKTSLTCAHRRLPRRSKRSTGWPDLIRSYRYFARRPAMPSTTMVISSPRMSRTTTSYPASGDDDDQDWLARVSVLLVTRQYFRLGRESHSRV